MWFFNYSNLIDAGADIGIQGFGYGWPNGLAHDYGFPLNVRGDQGLLFRPADDVDCTVDIGPRNSINKDEMIELIKKGGCRVVVNDLSGKIISQFDLSTNDHPFEEIEYTLKQQSNDITSMYFITVYSQNKIYSYKFINN